LNLPLKQVIELDIEGRREEKKIRAIMDKEIVDDLKKR
jgi:hypothetical protein